jgi:uncharacterized protein YecE (DUF72 family)
MAEWLDEGRDVYAYFNNDYHGYAVRDATWLRDRLQPDTAADAPSAIPSATSPA